MNHHEPELGNSFLDMIPRKTKENNWYIEHHQNYKLLFFKRHDQKRTKENPKEESNIVGKRPDSKSCKNLRTQKYKDNSIKNVPRIWKDTSLKKTTNG